MPKNTTKFLNSIRQTMQIVNLRELPNKQVTDEFKMLILVITAFSSMLNISTGSPKTLESLWHSKPHSIIIILEFVLTKH